MAANHPTSRRTFLKAAALGSVGAALGSPVAFGPRTAQAARPAAAVPFKLGVASYSLRKFSRPEAIAMIKALRASHVSVKSFHMPYEDSPEELAAGARAFAEAGIEIVSGGNNNIREDNDEHVRMFFEYAKAAGIPMLVIAPTVEIMPRIERFVKEYDIRVAIHNHGPEDKHFPGPKDALKVIKDMDPRVGLCVDVLKVIKDMDPRVGLCVDVGHTARTGVDVVEAIAEAGDRLLDMHMKGLRDLSDKQSQCIVGEGAMPVAGIFRQLTKMNYQGYVNLEYEIDADDPLPGMKQSFAYMRGVLAGMESEGHTH